MTASAITPLQTPWTCPQRITLGLSSSLCRSVMDEWLHRCAPVELRLRRARTPGLVLVMMDIRPGGDQDAVLFASWVLRMAGAGAKVDIKLMKP